MRPTFFAPLIVLFFLASCANDDSGGDTAPEIDKNLNRQSTGSSSADLLSDETFDSMVIELAYIDGFEPTAATVSNLVTFFENRTFKPGGIRVVRKSIPSPGTSPYSIQEIVDIEEDNREFYNTDSEIAVWMLFVDGENENDTNRSKILGTAYRNTSVVMYQNTIENLSDTALEPSRTVLETTATQHEIGHILGLVNLGAPLQSDHEDEENERHCDVTDCLMFFMAETGSGAMDMIQGGMVPELDSQCIADLRANGGR